VGRSAGVDRTDGRQSGEIRARIFGADRSFTVNEKGEWHRIPSGCGISARDRLGSRSEHQAGTMTKGGPAEKQSVRGTHFEEHSFSSKLNILMESKLTANNLSDTRKASYFLS
jgi:hypothetical protein